MEEPFPITPIIELKQKVFEIISERNKKYKIILQNNSGSLLVSASYEENSIDHNFEGIYSLDKIKENKIFKGFNSLTEILEEIYPLLEDKKAFILGEEENSIIFKISLPFKKENELIFHLDKKQNKEKESINEKNKIIEQLKKELNDLKEKYNILENKEKENENENLKIELKNLKKKYNIDDSEEEKKVEDNNSKNKDKDNNEVNIIYKLQESKDDNSIRCNKYITIKQLKELIMKKHNIKMKNVALIFLGLKMNEKYRVNDYQIKKNIERVYIFNEDFFNNEKPYY